MTYLKPSRVPAAFAAAATSAAAVVLAYSTTDLIMNGPSVSSMLGAIQSFILIFMIALFHALLIGLPAHQLVPIRWRYSLPAIAIGSFLVGGLPMPMLLYAINGAESGGSPFDALAGWWASIAALGLTGLPGGLVFWLIVRHHPEDEA